MRAASDATSGAAVSSARRAARAVGVSAVLDASRASDKFARALVTACGVVSVCGDLDIVGIQEELPLL